MECRKCGEDLIFINTDKKNCLKGHWICTKCKPDDKQNEEVQNGA